MAIKNVKTTVEGNQLIIRVDISPAAKKQAELSGSGKTKVVGSTGGFIEVPEAGVKVGLNVTCPKSA